MKVKIDTVALRTEQLETILSLSEDWLTRLHTDLYIKTSGREWDEILKPELSFSGGANGALLGKWFVSGSKRQEESLFVGSNKTLSVQIPVANERGFYVQTGGQFFSVQPTDQCWKLKEGVFRLDVPATLVEHRLDCSVFVIFFGGGKKIGHIFQQLYPNKNEVSFQVDAGTECISIALRFRGHGAAKIGPLRLFRSLVPALKFPANAPIRASNDLIEALENRSNYLADRFAHAADRVSAVPLVDQDEIKGLREHLANSLYAQLKLEKSLEYRLGKLFRNTFSGGLSELIRMPGRLIKVRAAARKGKFKVPPLHYELKTHLLSRVGVFVQDTQTPRLSWPPYEPKAVPRNQHINIACIADPFTFECFRYEANFIKLSRSHWLSELESIKPAFFFLESAWNGNDGEWAHALASYKGDLGIQLRNLIQCCKRKHIPVVFWNKEDPTNFKTFIDVARDCDFIFTTAGELIQKYKAIVKHENVYVLPFAAQPAIHNPIREKHRKLRTHEICFAGSWYEVGHESRKLQTKAVLDGACHRELHIYDRMLNAKKYRDTRIFPPQYQKYIVGSLGYDQMLTAYRQYKVFLNINTVQDSATMFSRRVFEILACGTSVVSTPSVGMQALLGEYVLTVNSAEETRVLVNKLLSTDVERESRGHQASRYCLTHHSYEARLSQILSTIGMPLSVNGPPLVSVVVCTNRPENLQKIINNHSRQSHQRTQLIVVLNNNEFELESVRQIVLASVVDAKVFQLDEETTLGACLNFGFSKADGEYLAKMDDDDIYGENYLSDALIAFKFSGAKIVGKESFFGYIQSADLMVLKKPGKDNAYSNFLAGGTLVFEKSVFEQIKFEERNRGEDTAFLRSCNDAGLSMYSSDRFNFIQMRYSDKSAHTWKIEDDEYIRDCSVVCNGFDVKLAEI